MASVAEDGARVDVVLPTVRRPHTIGWSIESVLAQTHRVFRLHVVGDRCDGATEERVGAFDDPHVSFRRFPKAMGYGYVHRNTVLRETDGP